MSDMYDESTPRPDWRKNSFPNPLVQEAKSIPEELSFCLLQSMKYSSLGRVLDSRAELVHAQFDETVAKGCGEAIDVFLKEIKAHRGVRNINEDGKDLAEGWIWDQGALLLQRWPRPYSSESGPDPLDCETVEGRIVSQRAEDLTKFFKVLKDHPAPEWPRDPPDGQAYVLSRNRVGEIEIKSIGLAGAQMEPLNYAPDVVASFERAVKDLKSETPRGRLILLEGIPGTGKTYLVRAFMNAVPDSKFVIIPPHLVKELADPDLIVTFVKEMDDSGGPMVIILEDADQCLSKRKSENMSAISSILNLSDGIVGSLLDLRVLATTNTKSSEFDEALLRKGRMSAHIQVGSLDPRQATELFYKIVGPGPRSPFSDKPVTLAEVYAAAKEELSR